MIPALLPENTYRTFWVKVNFGARMLLLVSTMTFRAKTDWWYLLLLEDKAVCEDSRLFHGTACSSLNFTEFNKLH